MATPTIESRLRRRLLLLSPRAQVNELIASQLPEGWEMLVTGDLDRVGELEDVLQFRMVLVDLDGHADWDPIALITTIRGEMLLNVPVLCLGGDHTLRDRARLARADRFFSHSELLKHLPELCARLGW